MFLIFRSAQILLEKKKNSTIFNRSLWKKKDFISGIVLFLILNISRLIETNTFRPFSVFTRLNEMMKEKKKKRNDFFIDR